MIAGMALGVGLATLRGDSEDDGNVNTLNGELMHIFDDDDDDNELRRIYYLIQWGFAAAGCVAPRDAPLYLSCGTGGVLNILDIGPDVSCLAEGGNTFQYEGTEILMHEATGMVCHLEDLFHSPEKDDKGSLAREQNLQTLGDTIQASSQGQRNAQVMTQNSLPELQVNPGQLVAYCEGRGAGLVLSAVVDLETRTVSQEEQQLPEEERTGFCNH